MDPDWRDFASSSRLRSSAAAFTSSQPSGRVDISS